MRAKRFTVGLGVIATAMSVLTLSPSSAYADYAPSSKDVVGVGSDTLQTGFDFLADGDHLGDIGYNTGKRNKFVSIDATADANARLAYGAQGVGSGTCAPGNGSTPGTGNKNVTHADKPCTLNPTVVLRAGKSPVPRPNGSGAGYNLLVADTNTTTGKSINGLVDFARSSSQQVKSQLFDQLQIGNDPVGILTSTTTNAAPALSIQQLASIYTCNTSFRDWGTVGGVAGHPIVPLIPQVGSGTRSYFLGQIGVTEQTLGQCVVSVEENDPEAIDASGSSADAIVPMSQSRLYVYQGKLATGASNGTAGGYFKDPSCIALSTSPACAAGTTTLNPNVKLETTGTPTAGQLWYPTRPLYVYFRHADTISTTPFQPGLATNWVNTVLYDPNHPTDSFLCSTNGQAALSAAGIQPACNYTPFGGKNPS